MCSWKILNNLEVIKVDFVKHWGDHHGSVGFDLREQRLRPTGVEQVIKQVRKESTFAQSFCFVLFFDQSMSITFHFDIKHITHLA